MPEPRDQPHDASCDRALATVGERIRFWRLRRGYTQDQVAEAIGITQTALSHYETGKRRLLLSTTLAIAAALDIPLGELVTAGRPGEIVLARGSRVGQLIEQLLERPDLLEAVCDTAAAMMPKQPVSSARVPATASAARSL